MGYEYTIQYKASTSNMATNALSQIEWLPEGQCFILSIPNFVFMDHLRQALLDSSEF